MPERQALLDAANDLKRATDSLTKQWAEVDRFAHETRTIANRLIAGLVALALVAAATIVGVVVAVHAANEARDANSTLDSSNRSRVASCLISNEERALTKNVISGILVRAYTPAGGRKLPPAIQRDLEASLSDLAKGFKPRDCAAIAESSGLPTPKSSTSP